jgi:hypothetical protein
LEVTSTQTPPQQPWPAWQQTPLQATTPAVQVRQSVPAVLQPLAQVVVAAVGHTPAPLQATAAVLMPLAHDCVPQLTVGYEHCVADEPPQVPAHVACVPLQGVRVPRGAPVTVRQVPAWVGSAQAWH